MLQLNREKENSINTKNNKNISGPSDMGKGKRPFYAEQEEQEESSDFVSDQANFAGDLSSDQFSQLDSFTQERQKVISENIDSDLFDPNPPEQELHSVLSSYHSLLRNIKQNRKEMITNIHDKQLNEFISEADRLYSRVKRPIDSVLDSKLIIYSADIGYRRLKNCPTGERYYSLDDFVEDVLSKWPIGGNALPDRGDSTTPLAERVDFGAIGRLMDEFNFWKGVLVTSSHKRRLAIPRFQRGVPDEVRTRKPRTRMGASEKEEAELEIAKTVKIDEQTQVRETTEFVIEIFDILQELGGRVPFYKFVLHPTSFARSVENIFYVSFLIRDNRVKLGKGTADEEHELMLEILDEEDDLVREGRRRQHIMVLTMNEWNNLLKKYSITIPMIANRQQ